MKWCPSAVLPACLLGLGLTLSSQAALKVMAIGDSMTEEYYFEVPFSAPDSDPLDANTMNWVEILHARRSGDIDFGRYENSLLSYRDWRDAGFEYNWGIPGYDTDMWMDIINASLDWPEVELLPDSRSRDKLRSQYDDVDVVVIMLGGNDIRSHYGELYDPEPGDPTPAEFINNIISNLTGIINEIRDVNPAVPIVLADAPDLGATPDKIDAHPDPVKRANASAIINDLNLAIAALATSEGATLAPISNLTDRILSSEPLYIGAIEMIKDKDPENPSNYLFCKGGLHPSTNGQAIIANTLLAAINTATNSNIPLLPDREILADVMGLDPDQPYKDWATTAGLTDLSMSADKDGDGIPNLGEYLLNLNPMVVDDLHVGQLQDIAGTPMLTIDYSPDASAARLADVVVKQSVDLSNWTKVPAASLIDMGSGQYQARMPLDAGIGFFRMEFQLKP
ncbi:MAG: SGNH/GDSL hydrolase family protein [Akkermansiaceae bacterium]|nr:SGNH/GDSL hydrolase family protein [Akkermansiaceae bacterium]